MTHAGVISVSLFVTLIGLAGLLRVWGNRYIQRTKDEALKRFTAFETQLENSLSAYTCFTNNHPWVWGADDYQKLKRRILANARWYGGDMFPHGPLKFDLKADEEHKYIY